MCNLVRCFGRGLFGGMSADRKRFQQLTGSFRRVATTAIAAALFGLFGSTSVGAEDYVLGYQLAWGPFTIGETELAYRESLSTYHFVATWKTRGLLNLFYRGDGWAETEGLLQQDGRQPLLHKSEIIEGDENRQVEIHWNDAAEPRTEARPPSDPKRFTPVPEGSTAGTSDFFTAILSIQDQLAATGRCEAERKIWDGRRRYDVSVSHWGEEELVADRPWAYEGTAIGCALSVERVGGFRRDRERNPPIPQLVWVAEIAPDCWVLVRSETSTGFGTVVARLRTAQEGEGSCEGAGPGSTPD